MGAVPETSPHLSWRDFQSFLERNFGKIAPMAEYYKDFENMKQMSSVSDYVTCLKTCVNKSKGQYLQPSDGQVTVKVLRGLRPHIAKLIENNAPEGWWKSSDEIFAKAFDFWSEWSSNDQ